MNEIWKDIYFEENGVIWDYRGLYQVSSKGKVKSLGNGKSNNSKEKILSPVNNGNGYLFVYLCKDKKKKMFYIHRLIAHMFIENDDTLNNTDINHKDENKKNNSVENLEWCTRKHNINHGTHNERSRKARSRKVIGYSLTDTKVIILKSTNQANKFGFSQGHVTEACSGKYYGGHEYKGYKWYYFDDIKYN